jgi:hypothetical protein
MLCYEMFTIFINFLTVMTVCHVFTGKLLKNIERDVPSYRSKIYLGNDLF